MVKKLAFGPERKPLDIFSPYLRLEVSSVFRSGPFTFFSLPNLLTLRTESISNNITDSIDFVRTLF